MDGHAGYDQIFITEADVQKMVFQCPGTLGIYKYVVMLFGLKNAGATYQCAKKAIFHDPIRMIVEVYINHIVVKSKKHRDHLTDLQQTFEQMRQHNSKTNPKKMCSRFRPGTFLFSWFISGK